MAADDDRSRGDGAMLVPRSRGALSGLLLVLLGVWGALVPFVGPYADYAYTPDSTWVWTAGRFWLEVLPGAATAVGGLLLLTTANRAVGVLGGYLAAAGGAWFVVGPVLSQLWSGPAGAQGTPVGGSLARTVEQLGFFSGLGAVALFLAAQALGRFTVRGVRDAELGARRREQQRRLDAADEAAERERTAGERGTTDGDARRASDEPAGPRDVRPVAPTTSAPTTPGPDATGGSTRL